MRTLIIGAGPIGVEAGLLAAAAGHELTVVDRRGPGASLLRWGATRFFSPFHMNVSDRMREVLGPSRPAEDALLTGTEMVKQALGPATQRGPLEGHVIGGVNVVAVGRRRLLRRDHAGNPQRHGKSFSVLWERDGREERHEFDMVLDASGNSACNYLGEGGLPALGERALSHALVRHLGDVEEQLDTWAGRGVLVVGHGHSAACALVRLGSLAERAPRTHVLWATRSRNRKPCQAVASDPLPERSRTVNQANAWAHEPPAWLDVKRKTHVVAMEKHDEGLEVSLSDDSKQTFDAVLAFTGYHPKTELSSELQLHVSPVTGGAYGIYRALSNVTDCLSVPRLAASDLASGEPGFYLVGSKSYGRMATFLLKDGIQQLETIFDTEKRRG